LGFSNKLNNYRFKDNGLLDTYQSDMLTIDLNAGATIAAGQVSKVLSLMLASRLGDYTVSVTKSDSLRNEW